MMSEETGNIPKTRVVRKKQADNTAIASAEETSNKSREQSLERRSKLGSVADRLAGSTFHYRNWYYKEGKEKFPQHDNLRYVSKMYPYAEGGMLLVDEPRFPYELERCNAKKEVLLKLGYRYLIITQSMTLSEAAEVLNELGHIPT